MHEDSRTGSCGRRRRHRDGVRIVKTRQFLNDRRGGAFGDGTRVDDNYVDRHEFAALFDRRHDDIAVVQNGTGSSSSCGLQAGECFVRLDVGRLRVRHRIVQG